MSLIDCSEHAPGHYSEFYRLLLVALRAGVSSLRPLQTASVSLGFWSVLLRPLLLALFVVLLLGLELFREWRVWLVRTGTAFRGTRFWLDAVASVLLSEPFVLLFAFLVEIFRL